MKEPGSKFRISPPETEGALTYAALEQNTTLLPHNKISVVIDDVAHI